MKELGEKNFAISSAMKFEPKTLGGNIKDFVHIKV